MSALGEVLARAEGLDLDLAYHAREIENKGPGPYPWQKDHEDAVAFLTKLRQEYEEILSRCQTPSLGGDPG